MTRPTNPRLREWDYCTETLDRARLAAAEALDWIRDARRGYPGSGLAGGGGRGNGGSPVEVQVLQRDDGGQALREFDAALRMMRRASDELARLVGAWAPREPSHAQVVATDRLVDENAPECFSHRASLRVHEPMHRRTTAGDVLPDPMALCRWCYDFARSNGRLPLPTELRRHERGDQVRVSA